MNSRGTRPWSVYRLPHALRSALSVLPNAGSPKPGILGPDSLLLHLNLVCLREESKQRTDTALWVAVAIHASWQVFRA